MIPLYFMAFGLVLEVQIGLQGLLDILLIRANIDVHITIHGLKDASTIVQKSIIKMTCYKN